MTAPMIATTPSTNAAAALVPTASAAPTQTALVSVPFAASLGFENSQDFPKEIVQIIMEYNLSVWMLQHQNISPTLHTKWSNSLISTLPFIPRIYNATILERVQMLKAEARFLCMPQSLIETVENEVLGFAGDVVDEQILLSTCFPVADYLYSLEKRGISHMAEVIQKRFLHPCSAATDVEDDWNASQEFDPVYRLSIVSPSLVGTLPHAVVEIAGLHALVIRCPQLTSFPSASLPYDLQFLRVECSQTAVPSLLKLLATYRRVDILKKVILVTHPALQKVPADLQTFVNKHPACKVVWNETEVEPSISSCVIS